MVGASFTPDGDIRFRGVPVAEVQYPEVLEYFLDDGLIYQFDPVGVGCLQWPQGREDARRERHRCLITLVHVAQRKLRVVGEQHPVPAHLIFERQRLCLELDSVVAGDIRPDVEVRSCLEVRMAKLENDLRIASRETILIANTPAQYEGMVVEPKVRGV